MDTGATALAAEKQHPEWLPILEYATREVFETMLGCQLTRQNPDAARCFDTSATVGLTGRLKGTVGINCEQSTAALIASRMLGIEPDQARSDLSDALGEICNMVAGNFKNKISGLGDGCLLSPPSVVTGEGCMAGMRLQQPTLEVNLLFESSPIRVTIHIENRIA